MSKKYPRFHGIWKTYKKCHPNNRPTCECCGEKAVVRIHMEVDYMRGNDEDFIVCQEHLDMAKKDPLELYETYEKFTKGQTEGDGNTGYGV